MKHTIQNLINVFAHHHVQEILKNQINVNLLVVKMKSTRIVNVLAFLDSRVSMVNAKLNAVEKMKLEKMINNANAMRVSNIIIRVNVFPSALVIMKFIAVGNASAKMVSKRRMVNAQLLPQIA